ncbi:hypothetical protein ACP4OV_020605 [Aristida adscensionis]
MPLAFMRVVPPRLMICIHARTMRLQLAALLLVVSSSMVAEPAASPLPLPAAGRRYDSILSFGDSFADTGNNLVVFATHSLANPAAAPTYGITFFGHPTGRNSNGRLVIDFIAEELGLPYVPPFLSDGGGGNFPSGVNFAVAGATALDAGFFGLIPGVVVSTSTAVQLQWFESLKPSLCGHPSSDCEGFFHRSLFLMGEFGVNDYALSAVVKNLSQIRSFVPDVVRIISTATERLIEQGAKTVVVPGIPPLGCSPPILAMSPSADPADYDPQTGCLKQLNDLAMYHNSLLQEAIEHVQTKHRPDASVIYADFFTPVMDIVVSPQKFGFTRDILKCCCGGGGEYNFN